MGTTVLLVEQNAEMALEIAEKYSTDEFIRGENSCYRE